MEPRLNFVAFGVADFKRATDFCARVLRLPQLKTPPTIAFFEPETKLSDSECIRRPHDDWAEDITLVFDRSLLDVSADQRVGG
jgi:hypothetical protein